MKTLFLTAVLNCWVTIVLGVQCRVGFEIKSSFDTRSTWQNVQCAASTPYCLFSTSVATLFNSALQMSAGRCSNETTCRPDSCNAQIDLFPSNPEIASILALPSFFLQCTFGCCQENLCNYNLTTVQATNGFLYTPGSPPVISTESGFNTREPTTTTTTVAPPNGVQCFQGFDIQSSEIDLVQWNATDCTGADRKCVTFKGNVLIDGYHNATVIVGKCASDEVCQATNCNYILDAISTPKVGISRSVPDKIQQCNFTCCRENLCNEDLTSVQTTTTTNIISPTRGITQPTTPTNNLPNGLACNRGYEVDIELLRNTDLSRQWNVSQCTGNDNYCIRARGHVIVASTFPSNVDAGLCVSRALCESRNCSEIAALMISADPRIESVVNGLGYSILNCSSICCQSNLCNEQTIEQIKTSTTVKPVSTSTTVKTVTTSTLVGAVTTSTKVGAVMTSTKVGAVMTSTKVGAVTTSTTVKSTTCGANNRKGNIYLVFFTIASIILQAVCQHL